MMRTLDPARGYLKVNHAWFIQYEHYKVKGMGEVIHLPGQTNEDIFDALVKYRAIQKEGNTFRIQNVF
jgi:hypothetical protein